MWVKVVERGEEELFMNEYSHTIDSKGRMILPARFREELGDVFILSPGLDTCLTIYPRKCWEQMQEKLQRLPQTRKNVRALRRFLIGKSTEMECDRQGRILIPQHLRTYAGLEKDAKIIGVGDTIEIWSPDKLLDSEDQNGSVADIAESLELPMDFNL